MTFDMYSGNSKNIIITVYDEPNGDKVNLTGATAIKFQIFHAAPVTADPVVSKSLSSGITNLSPDVYSFTVALSAADTAGFSGLYYYEAEVTDAAGAKETVDSGHINITLKRIT